MSSDEHSHEVISQLLRGGVFTSHVDKEAQQTRVLHPFVVSALQLLHVALALSAQRLHNQLVQDVVEELQVGIESTEARDELIRQWQVPIGKWCNGAMLSLNNS